MMLRQKTSTIKLLSWFNFLYNFRLYSVVAILYFAQVTHSYTLGISIFSIAQIARAVFEIPTGIYSDRLGRSTCLRIGAVASVLSITCYAIGQVYLMLVIGAIFEGACLAFFSGNNDALLYETVAETGQQDTYHEALGKVHSTLELAGFIGATVGGIIAYKSFSLLLWISAVPQVLALVLSFQFREPQIHKAAVDSIFDHLREALSYYVHNARLRNLSLANIIGYGVGEASWSFQAAFYSTVLPLWAVGFVMSLNFLASTISFRLSGRIIDKFKALNLLVFSEIYTRILCFIALIKPTIFSPFLMASASVLYGPTVVAQNTLLQTQFTDHQRATMASINSLMGSCFFAVFGVVIGLLADRVGAANALLFAQLCLVPILLLYLKVYQR
jgi:MFS family permease